MRYRHSVDRLLPKIQVRMPLFPPKLIQVYAQMIESGEVLEPFLAIIRLPVEATNEQRYIRIKIDSLLVLRSWKIIGGKYTENLPIA